MAYCWEIYNNSKCDTCKHYLAFQAGTLNVEEVKDIIVIDDDN
jgi:arsenate reductase-like glutaredoxin family protein